MSFIFRRKQYDPFIPDDIENKIIELDSPPPSPPTSLLSLSVTRLSIPNPPPQLDDYNEETFEPINEKNVKYLYDKVIEAIYVIFIISSCICFAFLLILYKMI